MSATLQERFAGHMGRLLGPDFPEKIGLAVSGGADSMAMLALTHEWARVYGIQLHVVTVDHGLRQASIEEATLVAEESAALGHSHDTLKWHWDGHGNLQDAARRARLDLISAWRGVLRDVLFAHTQNDQAETLLMRLSRGSGVEGLSSMTDLRQVGDWRVVRPLLSETRADLRHHVDVLRVPYVDDPSNDDDTYDRVRMRKAIAALDLDVASLADTATRMGRAKSALAARAVDVANLCVQEAHGDLLINRDAFATIERDTQMRLVAAALQWVSSAPYRPRASALEALLDCSLAGGGSTLHGARVIVSGAQMRVCREYAAVCDLKVTLDGTTTWDTRWQVRFPAHDGLTLRALGPDGWQQLSARPSDGAPHDAAIARPALFDGARLIAFEASTSAPQFTATLTPETKSFVALLVSR